MATSDLCSSASASMVIKGVKIGCTSRTWRRHKKQHFDGKTPCERSGYR